MLVVVIQKLFLAQHRQAALHAVGERRDVGARDEVGGQVEEVHEHLVAVAGESESKHDIICLFVCFIFHLKQNVFIYIPIH